MKFNLRVLITLALSSVFSAVVATQSGSALRGTWSASGAGQPLQGTWTAQAVPDRPDAAQGTWTLVNDARQTIVGGTWSAAKDARGWSGSWQARIVTRENPQGRVLSGTWRANAVAATDVKTLMDLLRHAAQEAVSGRWTSGGRSGGWSIRAN